MLIRDEDRLFENLHRQSQRFSPTKDAQKAASLMEMLFKQQKDFVNDKARFKSLLCPRRAGKSYSAAVYLLCVCLRKPNSKTVFATLTQKSARGILWQLLKQLDEYWQLGAHFHNTNVIMSLPNGSQIQLAGAESRNEIDKFRGQAYDLFVLDECKSFPASVITELVDQVVSPALGDRRGTLVLMGTPGNALRGVFYDVTRPNSAKAVPYGSERKERQPDSWSFHSWSTKDNVKQAHIYDDQLKMKQRNGWSDDNPIWLREYCGRWISDSDAFVYKFDPTRNTWERDPESSNEWGLPAGHEWHYILGCDLGFDDPFAVVVSAFSRTHPDMFEIYSWKQREMSVSDIAQKIFELEEVFGEFAGMVGDRGGLGKMVFEELAATWNVDIEPAEKTEKRDYIELLNSDLLEGRIKVRMDGDLADEWSALVWKDADKVERNSDGEIVRWFKEKENKAFANHTADAFLYSWRYSYHHFFQEREILPAPGSPAYWQKKSEEDRMQVVAKRQRERMEDNDYFTDMDKDLVDDLAFEEDDSPFDIEEIREETVWVG